MLIYPRWIYCAVCLFHHKEIFLDIVLHKTPLVTFSPSIPLRYLLCLENCDNTKDFRMCYDPKCRGVLAKKVSRVTRACIVPLRLNFGLFPVNVHTCAKCPYMVSVSSTGLVPSLVTSRPKIGPSHKVIELSRDWCVWVYAVAIKTQTNHNMKRISYLYTTYG